jgi:tRNA wybutosine-synthesizing protein 3
LNLWSSSPEPATPMVGIRSMGLALASVIGFERDGKQLCMVPEYQLGNLVAISNVRFKENTKRIERFGSLLREMGKDGEEWEDAQVRRERKRAEGLKKARLRKQSTHQETNDAEDLPDIGFLEFVT